MGKRIFILENHEEMAKTTSSLLVSQGFETKIILYPPMSDVDDFTDLSDLRLKENKVDYVIIDSLNGGWKTAAPEVERWNATPIIYSANEYVVGAAKDMGFYAFDKNKGLEEAIELIKSGEE
jgi:hypothetical protein